MISACPQYKSVCAAPEKADSGNTAAVGDGNRTATLKKKTDAVILKMAVPKNDTPNNFVKEVCSYVVKSECGAPVITFDATSDAIAASFNIYVTEYTTTGVGSLALVGDKDANKFYLP